jgi:phosphate acetyltransferase
MNTPIVTPEWQENVTFDEIQIGQSSQLVRSITFEDIQAFAVVSSDTNPVHLNPEYASTTPFKTVIAHGMLGGALISAVLGNQLPGPGVIYLQQDLRFRRPVRVGDTVTVTLTVTEKQADKKRVVLDCLVVNQNQEKVIEGSALVMAPTEKVRLPKSPAPQLQLFDVHAKLNSLIGLAKDGKPARCAVVHPCDTESLQGAMDAAQLGLIIPLLIGPEERIRHLAASSQIDLAGAEIIAVPHSHAAAEVAAKLAADGAVEMLMKGSLHTDELIHAVLAQPELRTGRRMSHVFRFDVPRYNKPLLITDAALNIAPSLAEKVDIVQNAIDFARKMGIDTPKVAILSAVETVNPHIPSTLDAAALCKMAERGQIHGGVLDGPLAFDNAVSFRAAHIKQIESKVAGQADILVAPDLESGNMLAKQLEYLAGASGSGLVLGAKVPIALTSRADSAEARISSAVLALLYARHSLVS